MNKSYPTLARLPAHLVASRVHLAILKAKKRFRHKHTHFVSPAKWVHWDLKKWLESRVLRALKCAGGNENANAAHWAFACALEAIRD